jgi:hypothetical protein
VPLLVALIVGLLAPAAQASVRKPHRPTLVEDKVSALVIPVTVHVATQEGLPVVPRRYVLEAVARANRDLREFGVELQLRAIELMPEGYGDLTRTRHRLRLAQRAPRDGSIHVFYVDHVELYSSKHGDRRISGMHWRYRGLRGTLRQREWVAVAEHAPLTTLVHEVGHLFGLGHRHASDNVMCSCQRVASPSFTAAQGRQLRTGARRFLVRAVDR